MTVSRACGIVFNLEGFPFHDLHESFECNGMTCAIAGGTLTIGFDHPDDSTLAETLAKLLVADWAIRHRIRISLERAQSWQTTQTGDKASAVSAHETLTTRDHITVKVTRAVPTQDTLAPTYTTDSASFAAGTPIAIRALSDPPLSEALIFYLEEVVQNDRPLYGVYKALERLAVHLGGANKGAMERGQKALAELVGKPRAYVEDVMSTAQVQRHAKTHASRKLSDDECRERAAQLIRAYAESDRPKSTN